MERPIPDPPDLDNDIEIVDTEALKRKVFYATMDRQRAELKLKDQVVVNDDLKRKLAEVEARLPPIEPSVPAQIEVELDPTSAARLEVLKSSIIDRAGGPQRSALQIAQDWVADGDDLLEVKRLVGHNRFGHYILHNFPLTHKSANNRMKLAKAVRAGAIKIEIIAKMGLVAALKILAERADPVSRERRNTNRPAAKSFHDLNWEEQNRIDLLFDDKVLARHEQIAQEPSEPLANREWPQPREDHQALIVSWRGWANTAYIWLRNSDGDYKLLLLQRGTDIPAPTWVMIKKGPWETIRQVLSEWSDKLGNDGSYMMLVADPLRTDILDDWYLREGSKKQESPLK
jgi:hypothetical protein